MIRDHYDVVVVGGGPAGTTFGHLLHRCGYDVLVVESARHPRFCVGESLLPATMPVWTELGLDERFEKAGFVRKYGAYFCFEDGGRPEHFHFPAAHRVEADHAWEVPRAAFDRILWDAAVEAGVHCVDETTVRCVVFDGERATGVDLAPRAGGHTRVRARLIADCSGRATQLGRQLGTRQRDPHLDKVALYCHYDGVVSSSGYDAGTIGIIAVPFGWMWLIPFAGGAASVGAVVDRSWWGVRRKDGRDIEQVWAEILERVPAVSRRLAGAERSRPVEVTANFQYRVSPLAGDGWVVIGDAGAFLDPVFSSGVHLAVTGARGAALAAAAALAGGAQPRAAHFARYVRRTRAALRVYSRFIYAWYDPAFRQVLMRPPHGRPGVELLKREVISVLAGAVLPSWRVMPAIGLLLLFARFRRRVERRGAGA